MMSEEKQEGGVTALSDSGEVAGQTYSFRASPDTSTLQLDDVQTMPLVEVKHAPFQSQPSLRTQMTEEQLEELGEKMRKEQAKKYFSLRVRD